ncbi:MAG: DUF1566 domain-containing protein [gamma proteobacterium symbiont of Taylorina sp.]|nr:DUF1566 domain-containing protein [gamma proteobacterium symbiont of Taylorina sp.]
MTMKTILMLTISLILLLIQGAGCVYAMPLNDTGITQCANATENNLTCPQAGFPGQDAEYGRDVTHNDDSDGHAGFSYTKIDSNGNDLDASAASWSCVRDNVTGLVWEVKTDDGGLRDKDWTYSWYNADTSTNGGNAGTANGGGCFDTVNCDTEKYVQQMNAQGLCGATDWRLPLRKELITLPLLDRIDPAIDMDYFPNTMSSTYWTASSYAQSPDNVRAINFMSGRSDYGYKGDSSYIIWAYVRLVRTGQ